MYFRYLISEFPQEYDSDMGILSHVASYMTVIWEYSPMLRLTLLEDIVGDTQYGAVSASGNSGESLVPRLSFPQPSEGVKCLRD